MKIVFHNGNKHEVDVKSIQKWSPKASVLNSGSTSRIVDNFPEAVWQSFMDLCHSRDVRIVPEHIPQLLQLIKNWEASGLIAELENRILQQRDPKLILKYFHAAPETFQTLRRVISENFNDFVNLPEMTALSTSTISSLMYPNTEYPSANAIRERFLSIRERLHLTRFGSDSEEVKIIQEISALKERLVESQRKLADIERTRSQYVRRTAIADERAGATLSEIEQILGRMKHQIDELQIIQMETNSITDKTAELEEQTRMFMQDV